MARSEGVSRREETAALLLRFRVIPNAKDEEPMRPMEDTGRVSIHASFEATKLGRTPCAAMEPEYLCSIILLPIFNFQITRGRERLPHEAGISGQASLPTPLTLDSPAK